MRNLHIRTWSEQKTGLPPGTSEWCKDPDTRAVYCLNNGKVFRVGQDEPSLLVDLAAEGLMSPDSECIGLCSLPDLQCLLIGISTGELIQVGYHGIGEVEEVGAVEAGLLSLSLSPDSEVITLVTADLKLILMTRDYTPLSETELHQEKFGEGEFVNVGWGKKETQFHGSEGKEARVKKEVHSEVTDGDDRRVRVSWRGDGEMLVVSYVSPGDQSAARKLRVFDRQGVLFSTSEPCAGLEQTLAWKPSGSLIATTVRKPNKHTVAFFEKNGLQHGEFTIRTSMVVKELAWNCDSTVLLVYGQVHSGEHVLQFWTVGNYHWYLKQTVTYGKITSPSWDQEDPTLCQVITTKDEVESLTSLTFSFHTDTSVGRTEDDLSMVAVTDGSVVKVTPMREAVIPPPMSAYEIHLDAQVESVMFQTYPEKNDMDNMYKDSNTLAFLTASRFYVFQVIGASDTADSGDDAVKITGSGGNGYVVQTSRHRLVKSMDACLPRGAANFVLCGDEVLASVDHPTPALVVLKERNGSLVEISRILCESSVYMICGGIHPVVELQDASVLSYEDGSLSPSFQFPRLCSHIIQTKHGVLGLNDRFKLFLNEKEIAGNITSMFLHSHFLLATTMDHRLVAVPADQLGQPNLRWEEAGNRRVERGSRLVTSVPCHSRTVLQMPRGNLETIQPRSLTVLLVQNLLDSLRFKEAFLLSRRQRINLNIIVDHSFSHFMKNISQFVQQVSVEPEHLNIFLAELKDENVCTTMYAAQYTSKQTVVEKDKVEKVCTAVREELELQDSTELKENSILPILGTLVRVGNRLEEALDRIKKLRDGGKQSVCDEALRFILYSVDVNVLFNVALGTYDFQLVLMVAEKSQKDPKEYLPILNNYKAMPENYMKYSIDKNLKKFESALVHISRCPDNFDECLQLVEENRLYKQATKLFPVGSDNYKSICQSYGTYMESKRYYLEASLLFDRAGQADQAVRAAERAGAWQRAGHLARQAGWSQEQVAELCRDMATKLEEQDRGLDSAIIWKEWLQDPEESVAVLSRCRCWEEGIRQALDLGRTDLVQTHILPGLRERRDVLSSTISTTRDKISSQVDRLLVVRESRNKVHMEDDVEDERNFEDADMFSETTSVGGSVASTARSKSTLATRQSNRSKTSKNRRKQDRKVYSTREGSTHEDLGLINELHEAIASVPGLVAEVAQVVRGLIQLLEENGLEQLQNDTEALLTLCETVKPQIWPGQEPVKERFGPESTVEDIIRGAGPNNQYRSPLELMEPHLRFPPRYTVDPYWKVQIL